MIQTSWIWPFHFLICICRYLVFTSKHHDGYTNFNSSYTFGWNSMSVGPKKNILKELKQAFTAADPDFHFGIYYSLFEWFNPMWVNEGFEFHSKNNMVMIMLLAFLCRYLKDRSNGFQTRYVILIYFWVITILQKILNFLGNMWRIKCYQKWKNWRNW